MTYSQFFAALAVLVMTALPVYAEETPAAEPAAVQAEEPAPDTTGIADSVLDNSTFKAEIPTPEEVVKSAKVLAAQAKPVAGNVVAVVQSAGRFKTLAKLLKLSGLAAMLETQGSYTLFAPSDQAFTKEQAKNLQKPEHRSELVQLLSSHIIGGQRLPTSALKQMQQTPATMSGQILAITNTDSKQQVNGVEIIGKSMPCSNGVIHVIEQTLAPVPEMTPATPAAKAADAQPK